MLKSLLWMLPLLASASPAYASEWWLVSSGGTGSNENVTFVDRQSMRSVRQGLVDAWSLQVKETADADGKRKSKALSRYDCENRTTTLISLILIANNDRLMKTINRKTYEQEPSNVVPDSIGEATWEFVCNRPEAFGSKVTGESPEELAARLFRE